MTFLQRNSLAGLIACGIFWATASDNWAKWLLFVCFLVNWVIFLMAKEPKAK